MANLIKTKKIMVW